MIMIMIIWGMEVPQLGPGEKPVKC